MQRPGSIAEPHGVVFVFDCVAPRFPVLGYQRLPYMTLATGCGIAGAAMVAFSPIPQTDVKVVVAGLFLMGVAVSWNDLLTEARYPSGRGSGAGWRIEAILVRFFSLCSLQL